jgi:hypothetical protein
VKDPALARAHIKRANVGAAGDPSSTRDPMINISSAIVSGDVAVTNNLDTSLSSPVCRSSFTLCCKTGWACRFLRR